MGSLRKVAGRGDRSLWPTHGPPRFDAETYVEALIAHRESRSAQIIDFIDANGPSTVPEMVRVLYASVREELHRPAARSVLAHLIELVDDGRVHTLTAVGRESALASRASQGRERLERLEDADDVGVDGW